MGRKKNNTSRNWMKKKRVASGRSQDLVTSNRTPTSFPKFGQLPKEIRDQIWDMAIQENEIIKPRILFFSLNKRPPRRMFHFGEGPHFSGASTNLCLNTPCWNTPNGRIRSWDCPENPSQYDLNHKIWQSCQEATEALTRNQRLRALVPNHGPDYSGIKRFSISGQQGNPVRYITLDACKDLVVFQVPGFTGSLLPVAVYMTSLPRFYPPVHNFAIEFDPTWMKELDEYIGNGIQPRLTSTIPLHQQNTALGRLTAGLIELGGWKRRDMALCFVEKRLRPRRGISYAELVKDCKVFQGKRQRFVECHYVPSQSRWEVEGERDDTAAGFCPKLWRVLETEYGFESRSLPMDGSDDSSTTATAGGHHSRCLNWDIVAPVSQEWLAKVGVL